MKISERWLREWVDPPVDVERLAEQLTGAGLEVSTVEPVAGAFEGVVVGRVLGVEPHPEADRLTLCRVDIGAGRTASVVCGAPNARAGLVAPYAPVGGKVAGGKEIRASRIRGVESFGMLCSPLELGLGEDEDGLLELAEDAVPGEPLVEHLALDDHSLDVELTPNRGDCTGLIGIAREVGVINRCAVRPPRVEPVPAATPEELPIALESKPACPKYVGRVIRGIDRSAVSPVWLKERLRRCGVRPISPVVDVTNYVMIELGQPLHAFDLDTLEGGIIVRQAKAGERLTLLDGQALVLDAEMLVIADQARAVALAGIMGGADTGVSESTENVFLEAAFFEPRHVAGDARRYGLGTDASYRFERGVDPDHQARAIERATALLLEMAGGRPGPVTVAVSEAHLPAREPVALRRSRIERLLGMAVDDAVVSDILERLELGIEPVDEGWRVTPPGFRFDIEIEADLIEEIARIEGYDNLPTHRPVAALAPPRGKPEASVPAQRFRQALVARGYCEAITYSFVSPGLQHLLGMEEGAVPVSNPISADMAVMRTSMWPGLIESMLHNSKRQQPVVRLFESGLVFRRAAGVLHQTRALAGLATGWGVPEQWGAAKREVDFFDQKADVEALLEQGGRGDEYAFVADRHPALHPGQSARIERAGELAGWMGVLHPRVTRELKHSGAAVVFELFLEQVEAGALPRFEPISKFPAVRRDISVVVDEEISARALRACVGQIGIDVLQNLEFFDVYYGEGIDSGKKSVSLSLTFQASSRTLNDEEVDSFVVRAVDALRDEFGAVLRG